MPARDVIWIVDVSDTPDEPQPTDVYEKKIAYAISCLKEHSRIVVCCGAGESRSRTIEISVLMKHYKRASMMPKTLREKVPMLR